MNQAKQNFIVVQQFQRFVLGFKILGFKISLIINSFLRINMQILNQAKALTVKAENFMKEGNYEYAARCYDRITLLLKQALMQATSKESVQAIKNKINKYLELKAVATAKHEQKQTNQVKITKFGFPDRNSKPNGNLNFPPPIKNINPPQVKPRLKTQNQNRKPMFEKYKPKVQLDPAIEQLIVRKLDVSFSDIVGLKQAKSLLQEAVIRPKQRPDLYTGIRAPPRGLLLYGPPGNGKTYICKALAKESGCTFFALSASSILNKFVGESQKMIRRVFAAAQQVCPSIIFIDQIDSMLTARSENQNQASRRLKTQFLVLMDGINSPKSGDILVIGATNLPKQLDSAAKRRFSKMIYIPNPDSEARKELLQKNLKGIDYDLSNGDINKIVQKMECYSASQIHSIMAEVCMIPLRELKQSQFQKITAEQLRKLKLKDFLTVLSERKPILSKEELAKYKDKV